jgi:hypothetical protein
MQRFTRPLTTTVVVPLLVAGACSTQKGKDALKPSPKGEVLTQPSPPAVLIVEGDHTAVVGQVKYVNDGGRMRPVVWAPNNVVIFRTDGNLLGQAGKAGIVYRINAESKLEEVGKVDIKKTNSELAKQFGLRQ